MRSKLAILIGAVLVTTLAVGGGAGAGPKEQRGADSLPPLSAAEEPLELVGDTGSLRLGVSIVSDTKAVAYLCDGESVGVWFTGTVDLDSGEVRLESKDGGTVTLNLNAEPPVATVVLDGETTTFTLAPVTGNGGLFRSVTTAKGHRWTTGWIVADDGSIVGLTGEDTGKTVATVNTASGGSAPPPSGGGGVTGPETTGAIRCAILAGRLRGALKDRSAADAAGDTAGFNEANDRITDLTGRATGAGCAGF